MIDREAVQTIRRDLLEQGFAYRPRWHADTSGAALLELARQFGPTMTDGMEDPDRPLVVTRPSPEAPAHQPFDRRQPIGWHNDFSTASERPRLTLVQIAEADPAGGLSGAWRAASARSVLARLEPEMLAELRRPFDFGYGHGEDEPGSFPILEPLEDGSGEGLRFYARSLREGALRKLGRVPARVEAAIGAVVRAADAVGETLEAPAGALLVVDNPRSLHDRLEQTVDHPSPRKALLCFVEELFEDITNDPPESIRRRGVEQ